jgi:hypothetical protein
MVKSYTSSNEDKDKIFNKLMKEHMGDEKVIDLRNIAGHIQLHAWLEFEIKMTDEDVKSRLITFLERLQ